GSSVVPRRAARAAARGNLAKLLEVTTHAIGVMRSVTAHAACLPRNSRIVDHARRGQPSPPSSPPGGIDSQISLHSGQTGNRLGSRLGTQTFPHRATSGVPVTEDSTMR